MNDEHDLNRFVDAQRMTYLKLRSCATLFALVSAPESVFARLLAKYFDGGDEQTLRLIGRLA